MVDLRNVRWTHSSFFLFCAPTDVDRVGVEVVDFGNYILRVWSGMVYTLDRNSQLRRSTQSQWDYF